MKKKTVFWEVTGRAAGFYKIQFWTKGDRSNALSFNSVTAETDKLWNRVHSITGDLNFELVQIRPRKG